MGVYASKTELQCKGSMGGVGVDVVGASFWTWTGTDGSSVVVFATLSGGSDVILLQHRV